MDIHPAWACAHYAKYWICFNGGRVKEVAGEPKERKLKAQDQHLQVQRYVEFWVCGLVNFLAM